MEERSEEDGHRDNPQHLRLTGGQAISSSSSESSKSHSMEGKAIDASTFWDASSKTLISKEKLERDRFKLCALIMGFSLLTTGVGLKHSAFSRASVAGEETLDVCWNMVVLLSVCKIDCLR
jgi:hypothetical protein